VSNLNSGSFVHSPNPNENNTAVIDSVGPKVWSLYTADTIGPN